MVSLDNFPVRFSRGKMNFGKVKNRTLPYKSFRGLFETAPRSGETLHQYNKLTEAEQRDKKSAEGFWFRGATKGEVRKRDTALPSDLISLDFDYASVEFFESIRDNTAGIEFAYFIHTSRRHTPEKPRFRMVIPASPPIPNDLYPAAARIVAKTIDPEMKHVDPVSFRPGQMMFMPTASKDSEYVYVDHPGAVCDWESELAVYEQIVGDWRDVTKLPVCAGEKLRKTSDKAEDPTEKDGPVGDFCRAYDVPTAIEHFDLPYEPVDAPSGKPRYSYSGGTTVNGAEVQDGGLFLYSHHGSDPASDMLCNAFDLVRIHKFGHHDEGFDGEGKKPSDYPSWAAMIDFISKDEGFQKSRLQSRYDLTTMFDDLWDEDQEQIEDAETEETISLLVGDVTSDPDPYHHGVDEQPGHIGITDLGTPYLKMPRKRRARPAPDWTTGLEVNRNGEVLNTVANITMILKHDVRLRDAMAFNEFSRKPVMVLPIRHKIDWLPQFKVEPRREITGEPWADQYDDLIRVILESENGTGKHGWGLKVTDRDLKAAVRIVCHDQKFHPVREILESFVHDGEARAETLFIDYLGCPDTEYHRQAARLWLVAAVARIFEPGHKFDSAPVMVGPQGSGKSTFAKTLAMGFFGELNADFSNEQKLAEQMLDCWIMEMPELVSMTRSEVEPAKQFLSATELTVRMAYDRYPTTYYRQTVFLGSTNNVDFLKDDTGNRRFWPLHVTVGQIDIAALRRNLAQIWAEAVALYKAMRAEQPYGDLPLHLTGEEAMTDAARLQEESRRPTEVDMLAERIAEILNSPVTDERFDSLPGSSTKPTYLNEVTPGYILEKLGDNRISAQLIAGALNKLGWRKSGARRRVFGTSNPQSVYVISPAAEAAREEMLDEQEFGHLV